MPRPRTYQEADVVEAAKATFWKQGFSETTIADLEAATRLNRSSLYSAFGTKRELFDTIVQDYLSSFVGRMVAGMESPSAGLGEIVGFFARLKHELIGAKGPGPWGCLLVNAIAERSGRDKELLRLGISYRDRLRAAFAHALRGAGTGAIDPVRIRRLSKHLAAATFGVWVTARLDPADAARVCDIIAAEVRAWRFLEAGRN